MLLLFVFSALFGFFPGRPTGSQPPAPQAAAFSQALNLDAFADLPGDSFGAVYERLLQGETPMKRWILPVLLVVSLGVNIGFLLHWAWPKNPGRRPRTASRPAGMPAP